MAAGGHFGCPQVTFDRISGHFRSIRNFLLLKFLDKMAAILDGTTMSIIELVRDIWMSNACVKFEERSLNPSKKLSRWQDCAAAADHAAAAAAAAALLTKT